MDILVLVVHPDTEGQQESLVILAPEVTQAKREIKDRLDKELMGLMVIKDLKDFLVYLELVKMVGMVLRVNPVFQGIPVLLVLLGLRELQAYVTHQLAWELSEHRLPKSHKTVQEVEK